MFAWIDEAYTDIEIDVRYQEVKGKKKATQ